MDNMTQFDVDRFGLTSVDVSSSDSIEAQIGRSRERIKAKRWELAFTVVLVCTLLIGAMILLVSLATSLEPPFPRPAERGHIQKDDASAGEHVRQPNGDSAQPNLLAIHENKSDPQDRPEQDAAREKQDEAFYKQWSWINATAVSLFTLFLLITSGLQWWAMRCQSKHMQAGLERTDRAIEQTDKTIRHLELEQRPWLAITNAVVTDFEGGKYPMVQFSVKNCGKTPARMTAVKCCFVWAVPDGGPSSRLPSEEELTSLVDASLNKMPSQPNTFVVPPVNADKFVRHQMDEMLADWQAAGAKAGTIACVVAVTVNYHGAGCESGYTREEFTFDVLFQNWGIRRCSNAQMS